MLTHLIQWRRPGPPSRVAAPSFQGPPPWSPHMGLDQQCGCCWQISLLNGPASLENQEQDMPNKVIILPPSCAGREDERGKRKLALGGLQSRDRQLSQLIMKPQTL